MAATYLFDTTAFSDLMREHRKLTARFTTLSPVGRIFIHKPFPATGKPARLARNLLLINRPETPVAHAHGSPLLRLASRKRKRPVKPSAR